MDQCLRCTVRGDIKECLLTACNFHELWMVVALKDITKFMWSDIDKADKARSEGRTVGNIARF